MAPKTNEVKNILFDDDDSDHDWEMPPELRPVDSDFDDIVSKTFEAYPARSEAGKVPDRRQHELKRELVQDRLNSAKSLEEIYNILQANASNKLSFGPVVSQIEDLDEYFKNNYQDVIVNDIVTPDLAEKAPKARLFAEKFQSIAEPPGLKLKPIVKKLLIERMQKEFVDHKEEYTAAAVAQVKTFKQLEYVLKQFSRLKVIEQGKSAIFDRDDIKNILLPAIEQAYLNIKNSISRPDFKNIQQTKIDSDIEAAIKNIPQDTIGIKDKVSELLAKLIAENKTASQPPAEEVKPAGGLWRRAKNFFSRSK
jgi:hypothetical protein